MSAQVLGIRGSPVPSRNADRAAKYIFARAGRLGEKIGEREPEASQRHKK